MRLIDALTAAVILGIFASGAIPLAGSSWRTHAKAVERIASINTTSEYIAVFQDACRKGLPPLIHDGYGIRIIGREPGQIHAALDFRFAGSSRIFYAEEAE